jgi:DNA polymerase III subunit gamma/tau
MSYQGIARKYRPQTFDEVVGQRVATDTLKNAIVHNRVAHGYIFSGARGVGKTTTARILAKALNCAQGPTPTPDGVCDSCREIAAGNSVDVIEIDAASNRGIDEIRELRETVRYLPARDRYKVFIIDEAHMLTTEAFNALLKTLEEPPPRCLFILATTEAHKLPSTIQSRCQHFAFRLLDYSEIVARLKDVCAAERVEADGGSLAALAEAAAGSLRDALSLLDQVIAGCGARLTQPEVERLLGVVPARVLSEMVEAIVEADADRVLDQVQRLTAEGYEAAAFVGELTRFIRNLMIARSAGAESSLLEISADARAGIGRLATSLAEEDWLRFFQILLRAQSELRYALEPRFHLELALLKLVHARRLTSLESVLAGLKGAGSASEPAPAEGHGSRPAAQREGGAGAVRRAEPASPPSRSARSTPAAASPKEAPRPVSSSTSNAASHAAPVVPPAPAASPVRDPNLAAVQKLLYDQSRKFVSNCLEHVTGWRFENGVVQLICARQNSGSFWADLLNKEENQEAVRQACSQVLGETVSIRVTLQEKAPGEAPTAVGARERAQLDPKVQAFEKRFECVWLDVDDLRGN